MFVGNQHRYLVYTATGSVSECVCVCISHNATYMHKQSKNLVSCPAHAHLMRGWGLGTRLKPHFLVKRHALIGFTYTIGLVSFSGLLHTQKQGAVLSYPQDGIASNYPPTHFCPTSLLQGRQRQSDFLHSLFYPLQLEPVRNSTDW